MPDFMFAYHGGKAPETKEEGEKAMAAWSAWYAEIGENIVHPGAPVGLSKTVTAQGVANNGGANPLSGFTIIRADTIEDACAIAAKNPMVVDGSGSAEVAPLVEM